MRTGAVPCFRKPHETTTWIHMGRPGIPMIFEEVLVRLAQLIPLVAGSHLRIGGRIATPVVECPLQLFLQQVDVDVDGFIGESGMESW